MHPTRPRSVCLALLLAIACGDDDGTGDSGTTATTTSAASTSEATADSSGAEVTGPPAECEAAMCGEGELCVVPGECSDEPPFCVPFAMVPCDFGRGTCTLEGTCSGPAQPGALVCETCL